jgi:hypothetical protein
MASRPTRVNVAETAGVASLQRVKVRGPGAQVIPLVICTVTSSALVFALYLPWFGISTADPIPHYSAVSSELVPPLTSSALVPGTQKWGYLLLACAALVAALALAALIGCARSRSHLGGGPSRLCVAITSLALVVLVILEMNATISFGDQPLGFDWGAIIGDALTVLSTFGACFAWATIRYRWLWGP